MLLSPFLYSMFALPHDILLPAHWRLIFVTDPLNLLVPTVTTLLGGALALPVSARFPGFPDEQAGYLGVPLFVICWLTIRRSGWFLGTVLIGIVLCSMGPFLWVAGHRTGVALPWALFRHLPFLGQALPARFMLFAWLAIALIMARWTAAARAPDQPRRLIIGLLACLCLIPAPVPVRPLPFDAFFAPGRLQAFLGANARVLILPFGITGPSSFWQVENQFGFAQTGGFLGYPPGAVQSDNPIMRFYFGLDSPVFAADFARYCKHTSTQFVVAGPGTPAPFLADIETLGWPSRAIDDVMVFDVPAAAHG